MKTNNKRRNFFKTLGAAVLSAGLISALPLSLFSKSKNKTKDSQTRIAVTINPEAVKRKKGK